MSTTTTKKEKESARKKAEKKNPINSKIIDGIELPKSSMVKYIKYNDKKVGVIVSKLVGDNYVSIGTSVCNSKDKFDRKIGIQIAYKRAERWWEQATLSKMTEKDLKNETTNFVPLRVPIDQIMKKNTTKTLTIKGSINFFILRCKNYYKEAEILTPFGTIELGILNAKKLLIKKTKK